MGSIIEIRQMMAEGKLPIAQFEIEASLKSAQGQERKELLFLLLEFLNLELRGLSASMILEAASLAFNESRDLFHNSLPALTTHHKVKDLLDFQFLLIRDAEEKGKLAELLQAISRYQIFCVENKIPYLDPRILEISNKYFRQEFSLNLQRITLYLLQGDSKLVIQEISSVLLGLQEFRGRNSMKKIESLQEILSSFELNGELILYRNFLSLKLKGIENKRDMKSLLEFVIGIDDFRLLVLALDIAHPKLPGKTLDSFVHLLRLTSGFDFLYLEKNFPDLKKFFVSTESEEPLPEVQSDPFISEGDLALESNPSPAGLNEDSTPPMEDEELNLLKQVQYGEYSFHALCDLTIGFLQSDYLRAARSASLRAVALATNSEEKIRAVYLRITVLMKLRDYRSALDSSLEAMDLVTTEADLLSLLYVQADCHEHLGSPLEAKKVLRRILEIDEDYRLAKEKLGKLNEA